MAMPTRRPQVSVAGPTKGKAQTDPMEHMLEMKPVWTPTMLAPNWCWKAGMASILPINEPSKPPIVEPKNMKPQIAYT